MIIAGIQVTLNHPLPTPRGKENPIRKVMEGMPVGASFFANGVAPPTIHGYAKLMRPKAFATQKKMNGTRVWRKA